MLARHLPEEMAPDVFVREDALRVDPLADSEEVVEARVQLAEVGGGQGMGLGPMRSAGKEVEEGRGEAREVIPVGDRKVEGTAR